MKKDIPFVWSTECEEAFCRIKEGLLDSQTNSRYFIDYDRVERGDDKLVIRTDASTLGLGAVLEIVDSRDDTRRRPVMAVSRSLQGAETRYAPTDLELLAIKFATEKLRYYVSGLRFWIETDHQPLIPLLGGREAQNNRTLRWLNSFSDLMFTPKYIPGKSNAVADYLSRETQLMQIDYERELDALIQSVEREGLPEIDEEPIDALNSLPEPILIGDTRAFTEEDQVAQCIARYHDLSDIIEDQKDCVDLLQWIEVRKGRIAAVSESNVFKRHTRGLYIDADDVVHHKKGIVVTSRQTQRDIFMTFHGVVNPHMSAKKVRSALANRFWWPDIIETTEHWTRGCQACIERNQKFLKSPPNFTIRQRFEQIEFDLVLLPKTRTLGDSASGAFALCAIDSATRWPFIAPIGRKTATNVAKALFDNCFTFGFPKALRSDEGREFKNCTMKHLAELLHAKQFFGIPYRPQSQGMIERSNASIKEFLTEVAFDLSYDWDDPTVIACVLMCLRSRPHEALNGLSPMEVVTGQKMNALESLTNIPLMLPKTSKSVRIASDIFKIAQRAQQADADTRGGRLLKYIESQRCLIGLYDEGEQVLVRLPSQNPLTKREKTRGEILQKLSPK